MLTNWSHWLENWTFVGKNWLQDVIEHRISMDIPEFCDENGRFLKRSFSTDSQLWHTAIRFMYTLLQAATAWKRLHEPMLGIGCCWNCWSTKKAGEIRFRMWNEWETSLWDGKGSEFCLCFSHWKPQWCDTSPFHSILLTVFLWDHTKGTRTLVHENLFIASFRAPPDTKRNIFKLKHLSDFAIHLETWYWIIVSKYIKLSIIGCQEFPK